MTSLHPDTFKSQTTWGQAVTAPIASAVSSGVAALGLTASTALNTFGGTKDNPSTLKALWNNIKSNEDLGWYSKAFLALTALPATAIAPNLLAPVAGYDYGLYRGLTAVQENGGGLKGIKSAWNDTWNDVKTADGFIFQGHQAVAEGLGEWLANGVPHTPHYDVSPLRAAGAVFASGLSAAGTSAWATFWTFARSLELVPRILLKIADNADLNLADKAALASAVLMATPRAYATAAVAGGVGGYYTALKTGYTKGLDAAMDQMVEYWSSIYNASTEALTADLDDLQGLSDSVKTAALAAAPLALMGAIAGKN